MGPTQVIVVGSINVDLVVSVARLPRPGETVTGGTFERHFGGKGGNQAVAAARYGAPVTMVAAVGDDEAGLAAVDDVAAEGVDVTNVTMLEGVPTGVAFIMVDQTGENQIAVASGANAELSGALVEAVLAKIGGAAVLVVGFEVGDAAISAAVEAARNRGWPIIVNPAPARPLPPALRDADPIVVANEIEAAALGIEPNIVTTGSRGAVVRDGATRIEIAAPRVHVVDTTGGGDAFIGALAAELAAGASLVEAARTAVVAASFSVTKAGARAGMPRRIDVSEYLGSPRASR